MVERVGVILEPADAGRPLRDLVRDLAEVGRRLALIPGEKGEPVPRHSPESHGAHREGVDRGVAAEVPPEPRSRARRARWAEAPDEPAPQVGVAGEPRVEVELGPAHGRTGLRSGRTNT